MYIRLTFFLYIIFIFNVNISLSQSFPKDLQELEDSLLNKLTIAKNDSLKVDELYELSRKLYEHDYLKGIKYIDQSIELANRINYNKGIAEGHYLKGIIFYYMSRYDNSLEELFHALKLNQEINSDWLNATIYNYIGINYRHTNSLKKSQIFFEKSLKYYTNIDNKVGIANLNNNIGLLLFDQGKYDQALNYYKKGISSDENQYSSIANTSLNIILIHLKKRQFNLAYEKLDYLNSIKNKIDDFLVLAEFYYTFGCYYKSIEDYENAIPVFQKSIEIGREKYFWNFVKLSSKQLSIIYSEQQNYKKSLESYINYTKAKDSVLNLDTQKKIIQLEISNDYDKYLTQIKIAEQQKKIWYLLYGISFFLLCILLAFLYYRLQRKINFDKRTYEFKKKTFENKLQNSSLEKIQLEYQLQYNKKELDFKNNELVSFAIQIIRNNDFVEQIRQKLKTIISKLKKEENLKIVEELDLFVKQSMNIEKSRKEFYSKTKILHKTFLYKLNVKLPSLSSKEKELALLLKLRYSSKEISVLLNISPRSVDMARYRLRKKLNITAQTSLNDFFNSFENH